MAKINGKTVLFSPVILPVADGSIENKKLADYDGLPADCRRVNYLMSTGTQYIDSGVAPVLTLDGNGNVESWIGFEITLQMNPTINPSSANAYFFGASDVIGTSAAANNGINVFRNGSNGGSRAVLAGRLAIFNADKSGGTISVEAIYNDRTKLRIVRNGVQSATVSSMTAISGQSKTMFLFGVNSETVSFANGFMIPGCRIFSEIWNGADNYDRTILRDFVSVLDPNGRPAMYDKITAGYFYNANPATGADEFFYG